MINTFLGTALAIITIFGLILPTWHWLSMGWKESERKGTNPYIGGLFGVFVGYMIGFAIVGSFMILVELLGFDGRMINCYNFSGRRLDICQRAYGEETELKWYFGNWEFRIGSEGGSIEGSIGDVNIGIGIGGGK